ncbi:MAG: hypothetical protein H6724_15670 [Sandaracinus sp.]|nr:hypothetical protein [Sandaracinus sp.]
MSEWVARARRALDGADEPDVDVVAVQKPVRIDRPVALGLFSLVAGVALFAAGIWREVHAQTPFDFVALGLRFLGIAAFVRGVLGALPLGTRLALASRTRRYGLALADEGLLFREPGGEHAIAREHVAGAVEPGEWGSRANFRRFSPVYLLVEPDAAGHALIELPPIFDDNPGVLAEHLTRWRGPTAVVEALPPADRLASKVYDDAAHGRSAPGVAVLRHGRTWLRRGPYAALLFGAVFAEAVARLPSDVSLGILPAAALGVCVLIPLTWIVLSWRHVGPRRGLALVLTAHEALMRTRGGVLRARWTDVPSMAVEKAAGWSLLDGWSETRKLRFDRVENTPIRYDEAFLGVPADVALALAEAYRKGALGRRGVRSTA